MKLNEFTLYEAVNKLPEIEKIDFKKITEESFDFFLTALGFETRTISIAENIEMNGFKCDEVIVFNYSTNVDDNAKNIAPLTKCLKKDDRGFLNLYCDNNNFTEILRKSISDKLKQKKTVRILFDISVCSSKLLLTALKILFDYNVELIIAYTEAEIYYPLYEEYIKNPQFFKHRDNIGLTQGVETVVLSQEYVGDNIDNNPEFLVAFPTFKLDRTKSILIEIDEGIFSEISERLVWVVGKPNMEEPHRANRIKMLREINEIEDTPESPISYEISTLNYKETIEVLEKIYFSNCEKYHINISDLGSKMQSLGIAFFCQIRPDVSVYFSVPTKYNPNRYSEGVKNHWMINFGKISDVLKLINMIDSISITQ